jgi:hypothetical protein
MNPEWTEGQLEFNFSGAAKTEKPDASAAPLKSTDFWVTFPTETWLIEIKDPDGANAAYHASAVAGILKQIQNDALLKEHLLPKNYGVFAHLSDLGQLPLGTVRYGIVIGLAELSAADRTMLANKVQRCIDSIGPGVKRSASWPIAEVHNVESWNQKFPDMQITRHL